MARARWYRKPHWGNLSERIDNAIKTSRRLITLSNFLRNVFEGLNSSGPDQFASDIYIWAQEYGACATEFTLLINLKLPGYGGNTDRYLQVQKQSLEQARDSLEDAIYENRNRWAQFWAHGGDRQDEDYVEYENHVEYLMGRRAVPDNMPRRTLLASDGNSSSSDSNSESSNQAMAGAPHPPVPGLAAPGDDLRRSLITLADGAAPGTPQPADGDRDDPMEMDEDDDDFRIGIAAMERGDSEEGQAAVNGVPVAASPFPATADASMQTSNSNPNMPGMMPPPPAVSNMRNLLTSPPSPIIEEDSPSPEPETPATPRIPPMGSGSGAGVTQAATVSGQVQAVLRPMGSSGVWGEEEDVVQPTATGLSLVQRVVMDARLASRDFFSSGSGLAVGESGFGFNAALLGEEAEGDEELDEDSDGGSVVDEGLSVLA
jgi:hypothetical protein